MFASKTLDDCKRLHVARARIQQNSQSPHIPGIHAPRRRADVHNDHRDSAALFVSQAPLQHARKLLGRSRRRPRSGRALQSIGTEPEDQEDGGRAEKAASTAVSGKTASCRKRHVETVACMGVRTVQTRAPRWRLTHDNWCYRASIAEATDGHAMAGGHFEVASVS